MRVQDRKCEQYTVMNQSLYDLQGGRKPKSTLLKFFYLQLEVLLRNMRRCSIGRGTALVGGSSTTVWPLRFSDTAYRAFQAFKRGRKWVISTICHSGSSQCEPASV